MTLHSAMYFNSEYAAPEAFNNIKFLEIGATPDLAVYGASEFGEIYDVLRLNPNIDMFAGIAKNGDVPLKYLNFLKVRYEIGTLVVNMNARGFPINKEVSVMFGFNKKQSVGKLSTFSELVSASSLAPLKAEILNLSRNDEYQRILKMYGYAEGFLNKHRGVTHKELIARITDDVPPRFYVDLVRFLILAETMN